MSRAGRVLIEIRVANDLLMIDDCEGNHVHFLGAEELSEMLQIRLKKTASEIRQILDSYHPTTSNL